MNKSAILPAIKMNRIGGGATFYIDRRVDGNSCSVSKFTKGIEEETTAEVVRAVHRVEVLVATRDILIV